MCTAVFAIKVKNIFCVTTLNIKLNYLDESDETTAFLMLLSTWDKQELEQKLGQRVEFSKRAIGKVLQVFDRLLQRSEKLIKTIQGRVEKEVTEGLERQADMAKQVIIRMGNFFIYCEIKDLFI